MADANAIGPKTTATSLGENMYVKTIAKAKVAVIAKVTFDIKKPKAIPIMKQNRKATTGFHTLL